MKELLASWEKLCVSSASLRFVDINLRGTGQVMLQDNPLSGALFLAAIAWGSYAAGAPRIAIGGIVALLAATLTAYWVRADKKSLAEGLYGFNGILVGLALPTFLAPGPLLWVYVILGGAVSTIVMMWAVKVVTPWAAALTFPFVITTWLLLLATYGFAGLTGAALPTGKVVGAFQAVASDPLRFSDFVQGTLHSISQVF
jgi:urea transporter